MSGSRDLEGVHGAVDALDYGWARLPVCQMARISAKQWGAATEDGVGVCVHVCPLPMGMEREDKCE